MMQCRTGQQKLVLVMVDDYISAFKLSACAKDVISTQQINCTS
jgi:hypothetical protein